MMKVTMHVLFDLDREAWIMLVSFPEDLCNALMIARAISSFGIMVHWHELETLARVVVKVYLNDEAKIPDFKVNGGLLQKGCSWTVLCFVLEKKRLIEPQDEEAFITIGPLHPCPS